MRQNEVDFEFIGEIVGASQKAILFIADHWQEPIWIPRSTCDIFKDDDLDEDDRGRVKLKVRAWICRKNGWIEA